MRLNLPVIPHEYELAANAALVLCTDLKGRPLQAQAQGPSVAVGTFRLARGPQFFAPAADNKGGTPPRMESYVQPV
jgi:hypothetical protein